MGGGKCIWALDMVLAEMDSLSSRSEFLALPLDERLRLRNSLFRYGVRVNTDLMASSGRRTGTIQERCSLGLFAHGHALHRPSGDQRPERLAARIQQQHRHPDRSRNKKDRLAAELSPIGTVQCTTSGQPGHPLPSPDAAVLRAGAAPPGCASGRSFLLCFINRVQPRGRTGEQLPMQDSSLHTQMLVIADGDIAKNQLNLMNPQIPKGVPLPLDSISSPARNTATRNSCSMPLTICSTTAD